MQLVVFEGGVNGCGYLRMVMLLHCCTLKKAHADNVDFRGQAYFVVFDHSLNF
jgi:hypothetical protein